jgi:hypothetical protein
MKTLEDIRGRCRIEDGHWLWRGATGTDGRPRIYAPDYTNGGGMVPQQGARAVWHCKTGGPIAPGLRVFGICTERNCCNPAHMRLGTREEAGAFIAQEGRFKNKANRIIANRANGRKRSVLTAELVEQIQLSPETGRAWARRLRVSEQVVSQARRGELASLRTASHFGGLIG